MRSDTAKGPLINRNLRTDVFNYKYKRDFTKRKQVVPNVIKKKKNPQRKKKPGMKYV